MIADTKEHSGEHSGPRMALHSPQLMISKAWLAAARGHKRTAIELAREAADVAHGVGQYAIEAEAPGASTLAYAETVTPQSTPALCQ